MLKGHRIVILLPILQQMNLLTENPTGANTVQSRTWYSSGGVYQTYWDDGQYRGYYTNEGVHVGTSLAKISDNSSDFDDDDYQYRNIYDNGEVVFRLGAILRFLNW